MYSKVRTNVATQMLLKPFPPTHIPNHYLLSPKIFIVLPGLMGKEEISFSFWKTENTKAVLLTKRDWDQQSQRWIWQLNNTNTAAISNARSLATGLLIQCGDGDGGPPIPSFSISWHSVLASLSLPTLATFPFFYQN